MITLHRKKQDAEADQIEERFKDLILAYRVEYDNELDSPFIRESDVKISPGEEMENWFLQLESELSWQRSLSGDGCFIDPNNGNIC